MRNFLSKEVCEPLISLSFFFKNLYSKTLSPDDLDRLQNEIGLTLYKLKIIFPPLFFNVMVYLVVYLAEEAKVAGSV